ncbi:hypothetical protein AK830_g8252 [Neonectria ditissima]|uniref:Apple domain-containing protein n=1 Tax=Neonectria ditissima TaxID=78410 RepID=A0A0P7BBW4_9HYPO|nr:hypothetical protein AK830_g8252 [Neonectria ditissima]
MPIIKAIALLAGLACMGINAGPCSLDPSPTTPEATTTTAALPPDTTCNMEGRRQGLSGLKPLGAYYGAASATECFQICSDEQHAARCVSFTYTPSSQACVFWDIPVRVGGQAVPGTGVFYWDIACWANEPTSTATATPSAPTECLPSDAICEKTGTYPDYDEFATYRGAESAAQCWDICSGAHYAARCKSFLYGTYTEACFFYDVPASDVWTPIVEENFIYYWDKLCWANTGPC